MTANSTVATDTSQQLPTPETIEFEDLHIRLVRGGASKGTPIVMTSPWPESVYAFRLIWPQLAELGPLIAIDLPGFGRSDATRGALSPDGMGGFILRLLDKLGIERCHAIGPDVGTTAFLFAAAEQPERFATLTVGSGGTDMDLLGEQLRGTIEAPESALDVGPDAAPIVDMLRAHIVAQTPEDVMEDYRLSSANGRFAEAAAYVRAYPVDLPKLPAIAKRIVTPVLVLSGQHDPLVPPSNGDFLQRILPNCRHKVIDGGHFVWEDAPDAYARFASAWIRSGGSQA